ncbi:major tail protein [Mycobacterium phage Saguaro]|uniref:Major tail protein n=1 Tax=Mycobacterium phage Saguaro TaxID=2315616 RepID=A0A386K9V0_9CAUD|nr:major tail protein [Mycobacterium phage Saguaro]AYD82015.1 major tail protein [Mycobacterium phage Saguaro]
MGATFPLVKGKTLRLTKINSCGMPIAGPRNRLVTNGYVSLGLTAVMRDATDLTQDNAEGKECVVDRTEPERRWYTPALELCNVDPDVVTMLTGWETVLDANDEVVGFRDDKKIESEFGVAFELWTSGKSEDDCPDIPDSDAILTQTGSGRKYGYFLFGGTEWVPGDITISAAVATLTLTGRTIALPHWGRGPYNVTHNAAGEPVRLLQPTSKKEHLTVFRTPLAPPEATDGAVALATSTIFVDPDFYYGGPADEPAAETAPDQVAA